MIPITIGTGRENKSGGSLVLCRFTQQAAASQNCSRLRFLINQPEAFGLRFRKEFIAGLYFKK
jgi:hypothetical protein